MSTITKEWLQKAISQNESMRDEIPFGLDEDDGNTLAALRIALASLEAKSRKLFTCSGCGAEGLDEPLESKCHCNEDGAHWVESVVYTATPAPVSVPDYPDVLPCPVMLEPGLRFGKGVPTKTMLGALQRRAGYHAELEAMTPEQRAEHDAGMKEFAAMLQGADRPQNEPQNIPENIPATQFKPVADLYGLTSPTGGETSFTFDAVEARDFIDGGWSCQEYVELGRYQEALTDHSEDKLAMVDHSGDSNNMVEPVTTACKLRDAVEIIRNSGIAIDAEKIFAERDALNAPDCWCRTCRPVTFSDSRFVVCPECGNKRCPHANDHRNACSGSNEPGQEGSAYPAAPQLPQPAVETAHSSIIAEQLAHVLSGMKVTSHERAVINCAVDRLNKNAEMLQEAPAAPAAQEEILYEPSPTDSVNAPLDFTDVEDRAWVVGAEWMRDAFKGENPHLRIANDDDPAPITASGSGQWQNWIADVAEYLEGGLEADGELEAEGSIEAKRLLARRAAMLHGAEHNRPDAVDANLVEALRLVQCMLEDYRERNYGDAERWIRHIDTHMSDYSETHGDDAYSVLHDLLPAVPQQEA